MHKSESIAALAAALAKAQAKIEGAAKNSINPHFKNRYADLAAVWDAIREPLTANGLSVVQTTGTADDGAVIVTTLLMHSSGEWISSDLAMKPQQASPQGIGSVLSYARRYALAATVGVAQVDDDGEEGKHEPVPVPAKAPTSRIDAVKEKVATATGHRPAPVDAYKIEALKEATALHDGDDAAAKAWLRKVRGDADGKRPWSDKDVETVKQELALFRARVNAVRGGLCAAEMSQ